MAGMSQRTVGVGVIGFGTRIQEVVGRLSAAAGPAVRVRHVCTSADPCRSAAAALPDQPRVSQDDAAMLDDPATEWVLIGSRNDRHREQAVAALTAGKHVFCEKPVGTTLDEVAAVAAAHAATPDRQFVVGFVLRYAPLYRRIVQTVRDGGIGRLVSLEFNETLDFNHGGFILSDWRRHQALSGGHLLEKCSHDVDVVNWVVDAPATRAASFGGLAFFTPDNAGHMDRLGADAAGRPAYRGWGPGRDGVDPFTSDKSVVDHQVAILQYANGVVASFHTNLNSGLPRTAAGAAGHRGGDPRRPEPRPDRAPPDRPRRPDHYDRPAGHRRPPRRRRRADGPRAAGHDGGREADGLPAVDRRRRGRHLPGRRAGPDGRDRRRPGPDLGPDRRDGGSLDAGRMRCPAPAIRPDLDTAGDHRPKESRCPGVRPSPACRCCSPPPRRASRCCRSPG